jgi:hypothetical protein
VIVHISVNPQALSLVAVWVRIQLKMKVSSNFVILIDDFLSELFEGRKVWLVECSLNTSFIFGNEDDV